MKITLWLIIALFSINSSIALANDTTNIDAEIKAFQEQIKKERSVCQAPLDIYVNDEVIFGKKKLPFKEFINIFPSNREHFLQMYDTFSANTTKNEELWCSGRYYNLTREQTARFAKYWESLYTPENGVEWYKITLANLAGPVQIDDYPILASSLRQPPKENEKNLLTALKSLPLSTQKILVNLVEPDVSGSMDNFGRYFFRLQPIDDKERCDDDELCAYLSTLVDERFEMNDFK